MPRTRNKCRQSERGFHRLFLVAVAVTGIVATPVPVHPQTEPSACVTENFFGVDLQSNDVIAKYKAAVFRIEVRQNRQSIKVGTGYVIDAAAGYVLTAGHVVEWAFDHSDAVIEATSPSLAGDTLSLVTVARLGDPQDVALLKIRNLKTLATHNVRALDIAVQLPKPLAFVTIGYPRGKGTPDGQTAEYKGWHDDGHHLAVKQDVDEGDSGSPLIDQNGAVVATCVSSLSGHEALYSPVSEIQSLLNKIPADAKVDLLDAELRNSGNQLVARQRLLQELKWQEMNPTNLELYEWATRISRDVNVYKQVATSFDCPVIPAYEQRRLGIATNVNPLLRLASAGLVASIYLAGARHATLLGRVQLVDSQYAQAVELYQRANDNQGQAEALSSWAMLDLNLGRRSEASTHATQAIGLPAKLEDKASARVVLASLRLEQGQRSEATAAIENVLPTLHETKELDGQALAISTLGKIAVAQGNDALAFQQFSEALRLYTQTGDSIAGKSTQVALEQVNRRLSAPIRRVLTSNPSIVIGLLFALAVAAVGRYGVERIGPFVKAFRERDRDSRV